MRYSYQRQVIKNIVLSTKTHPTADWIYRKSKDIINNISLGTVYRNLKILEEMGSIKTIYHKGKVRYDGNTDFHQHFYCNECCKIMDIDMVTEIKKTNFQEKYDFKVDDMEIIIIGTCNKH